MVADAGGTEDSAASYLPVNLPQPIEVDTGAGGRPTGVWLRGRRRPIVAVRSLWRIDDRWWREAPVSRLYLSLLLEDGMILTVFIDLVTGEWFRQSYD